MRERGWKDERKTGLEDEWGIRQKKRGDGGKWKMQFRVHKSIEQRIEKRIEWN